MLVDERRQIILNALDIRELLTVADIVSLTQSSEATIRRDLEVLAQQKLLIRVHGGCKKITPPRINEATIGQRTLENKVAKNKIAAYIATHDICDDMVVYLDAGTSTHALIPFLSNKDILIVTNGIHHITPLIQQGNKVILLGGYVKPMTQAVIGSVCLQQLADYSFDLAIIGTNGIDLNFGLSTPDIEESKIKQLALSAAEKSIIFADHSKFDKKTFAKIADIEKHTIYTDQRPKAYQSFSNIKEVLL